MNRSMSPTLFLGLYPTVYVAMRSCFLFWVKGSGLSSPPGLLVETALLKPRIFFAWRSSFSFVGTVHLASLSL